MVHSIDVTLVVFACAFGGALLGMLLGRRLPSEHLSRETQNVVKLGMGTIATLSGLVLGLLVSTAKSAFDTADTEVKEISAKLVMLDGVLARYGSETIPVRAQLRHYVEIKIDELWPKEAGGKPRPVETPAGALLEHALDGLSELSPTTAAQRQLKQRAMTMANDIAQARWLLIEQNVGSVIPRPFLVIVIFWLSILFASFGVFAPHNATAVATMFVCALSVATALFLVIELSRPLGGVIEISSAAARNALAHMSR